MLELLYRADAAACGRGWKGTKGSCVRKSASELDAGKASLKNLSKGGAVDKGRKERRARIAQLKAKMAGKTAPVESKPKTKKLTALPGGKASVTKKAAPKGETGTKGRDKQKTTQRIPNKKIVAPAKTTAKTLSPSDRPDFSSPEKFLSGLESRANIAAQVTGKKPFDPADFDKIKTGSDRLSGEADPGQGYRMLSKPAQKAYRDARTYGYSDLDAMSVETLFNPLASKEEKQSELSFLERQDPFRPINSESRAVVRKGVEAWKKSGGEATSPRDIEKAATKAYKAQLIGSDGNMNEAQFVENFRVEAGKR
jgi:hypothetical protein